MRLRWAEYARPALIMRNDVKPVIPPPATPGPSRGGAAFDAERNPSVRRERGDAVDPAGPKPSSVPGVGGTGGAVTDPSGTTGPVSRSNDRLSTTTGKLHGDHDLERSARQGEAADINALAINTGDSSMSLVVLMALLACVFAILGVIVYLNWPDATENQRDPNAVGPRDFDAAGVQTE